MLPIVLDAAIRSTALSVVVLLGLKLLKRTNPYIHLAAWETVLLASLFMPFVISSVTFKMPAVPVNWIVSSSAALPLAPNPSQTAAHTSRSAVDWRTVCSGT
jgi:hypothetical protein